MGSIVLNPGVKEMLLNDTKDFLKSEKVRIRAPSYLSDFSLSRLVVRR